MAARVEQLAWRDIPLAAIELPNGKLQLTVGLASGLSARASRLYAATDRGPNMFVSQAAGAWGISHLEALKGVRDAKILPLPDMGPEIAELRVDRGAVHLVRRMPLQTRSGQRLSGRALPGGEMEPVFDMLGRPLPPDALGADTEAIAAMPGGGFFLAEEYGPSLLKADENGIVSERWVPAGREHELAHPDILVRGVLPARTGKRRLNRGFEALCSSADGLWLYVGFQSALAGEDERRVPVWKLDAKTGALAAEYSYPFDDPSSFRRDAARRTVGWQGLKICEFAWTGEDRLIVLERIAHSTKLYSVHLLPLSEKPLSEKHLLMSSDDFPEVGSDIEAMALLSSNAVLLASDNDFGVEGAVTGFWRVTFDQPIA